MKKSIFLLLLLITFPAYGEEFSDYFTENTLRIDYIFSGNHTDQYIFPEELSCLPGWAGKRHLLDSIPLAGDGQISMYNAATGKCIYRNSFSTLFQEWISTEEATRIRKAFENVFLLPYPKEAVEIEIILKNKHERVLATYRHPVSPDDILIHRKGEKNTTPRRYIHYSGKPEESINVAILAEGYSATDSTLFYRHAEEATEKLFGHEPFGTYKDRFNILAVAARSPKSGVSIPHEGVWKESAVLSHFDSFYSERYLTTTRLKRVHDLLAGIPYEHIIILAHTEEYGGGGIYNFYTLTTTGHPQFAPVVVHEFGHSFGGLADEYYYEEDIFSELYPLSIEPWEPNITTLVSLEDKWISMLLPDTPVPTPPARAAEFPVGLYEGGGYAAKGIYRPADNCRMRSNEPNAFCPVCQKALERLILFYTNPNP